jgi:hypothetical protein
VGVRVIDPLRIRAIKELWSDGVQLLARSGTSTADPVTMTQRDENYVPQSTFSIDHTAAQLLMDDLWHCGIRPSEGSGSAGAMAATQKHLEDMRKLVFEKQ